MRRNSPPDTTERDPLLRPVRPANAAACAVEQTPAIDPDFEDTMQPGTDIVQPSRKFVIEPATLLFCIGILSQASVLTQYMYYRVGQQYNQTLNSTRAFICDPANMANATEHLLTGQIQSEASQWVLYRNLACSGVAIVMMPLFASSSDYLGRKPALLIPAVGMTLDSIGLLIAMLLDLPLFWLIVAGGVGSLGGGYGAMLAAIFAYLADTTTRKQRPLRIAIIECTLGLAGVFTEPLIGWWIRLMGYAAPMAFSAAATLATLLYVAVLLPEVRLQRPMPALGDSGVTRALLSPFVNIAGLFGTSARLALTLALLLAAMGVYSACLLGITTVSSLYQMNYPFCLDSVFIGYLNAAKIVSFQVGMLAALLLLGRCLGVRPLGLSIIGMASSVLGSLATGLARSTAMLFAAVPIGLFTMLPVPMLRAYTSQIAPVSRQGALFSCISVLQVGGGLAGTVAFTIVYSGTQDWMPGFVYLTVACATLGALALVVGCAVINRCCPSKQTSWHAVPATSVEAAET